jgi:hypothetical protein
MFKLPFSRRNQPTPDTLKYEVSPRVRSRILHTLVKVLEPGLGDLHSMLEDAAQAALMQYGTLNCSPDERDSAVSAEQHFMRCKPEEAIDFIEWLFKAEYYRAQQLGVDAVNDIFRQEGIGYEFSPYTVNQDHVDKFGGYRITVQHPEATKKSNEVLHATTVMPALQVLSCPVWKGANEEMLKGHEHLRHGDFADAIHWAGKCLESVLQIICDKKKWKFAPDKDTLSKLLQACHTNGLFPSPYIEIFQKSSGEIRNKWSGHGKAISANGPATFEMAEHMIQVTSSHVLLLAKWSKL